jgi:hypothetical protein
VLGYLQMAQLDTEIRVEILFWVRLLLLAVVAAEILRMLILRVAPVVLEVAVAELEALHIHL